MFLRSRLVCLSSAFWASLAFTSGCDEKQGSHDPRDVDAITSADASVQDPSKAPEAWLDGAVDVLPTHPDPDASTGDASKDGAVPDASTDGSAGGGHDLDASPTDSAVDPVIDDPTPPDSGAPDAADIPVIDNPADDAGHDASLEQPDAGTGEVEKPYVPWQCGTMYPEGDTLFSLGSTGALLGVSASRVVAEDWQGDWYLWDTETGMTVAEGSACALSSGCMENGRIPRPGNIEIEAGLLVVDNLQELELRSAVDGHLIARVPRLGNVWARWPVPFGIARDGSYIWSKADDRLRVWSPAGLSLLDRQGDYTKARIRAEGSFLRITNGPAGADRIELISTSTWKNAPDLEFRGTFEAWFEDDARFITSAGGVKRFYSAEGVQFKLMEVSGPPGGFGHYFWTDQVEGRIGGKHQPLRIYDLDSGAEVLTLPYDYVLNTSFSGKTLSRSRSGAYNDAVIAVDLTMSPLVARTVTLPSANSSNVAFDADGNVYSDGSSAVSGIRADGDKRTFGCGFIKAIAAAPEGLWAISLSTDEIIIVDPARRELVKVIPYPADELAITNDGKTLAAFVARSTDALTLFEMPSGNIIQQFVSAPGAPMLSDFALSSNGARLARAYGTNVIVTDREGNELYRTTWGSAPAFAPGGTFGSLSNTIYDDSGKLVGATDGSIVTWLDDERLLVRLQKGEQWDTECMVVNREGVPVGTQRFDCWIPSQAIDGGRKLHSLGKVYDIATGALLWELPRPFESDTVFANDKFMMFQNLYDDSGVKFRSF